MPSSPASIPPTLLVIFGITGDLARRKLIPALWHLHRTHMLPPRFRVIGFARRSFTTEEIRSFVQNALQTSLGGEVKGVEDFLRLFTYQQGHFDEVDKYHALARSVTAEMHSLGAPSSVLFYLAVSPAHYDAVFESLSSSGLASSSPAAKTSTRILVEKPFGRDIETAQALDKKLGALFKEEQIYRIDHYLAKETVQNILNFRFSNFIFEPIWNKSGIEKVHIELLETLGMEGRGAFYRDVGALRDVGQNHMLQLLAMVAMGNPGTFDAAHIRAKRAAVLSRLCPLTNKEENVVRGQYEGFIDEASGEAGLETETYFKLKAFLNDPVWENVPFILESGKRMSEDRTRITVYFKHATHTLCPVDSDSGCQNVLRFEIKPREGITICFWAKKPGFSQEIEERTFHFDYRDATRNDRIPDAYERVLYDGIRGDQTLFASTDEVQAAWRFITPIVREWHTLPLGLYAPGTPGPATRTAIL